LWYELTMPRVNPAMLVWARETAGLTLENAARRSNIKDAFGQTGAERLAALEAGQADPTRGQITDIVKAYRRPLLTFYMPQPPAESDRGEDFRTFSGPRPPDMEGLLDALLRDVRTRHLVVRDVVADDEDATPVSFVGSLSSKSDAAAVLRVLQTLLPISREALREERTAEGVFSRLRGAVEALGVFVLLVGDLGNHHTTIDAAVFRGYAIADRVAPFIVINDKDTKTAWSFTLLHEMAHLIIGASGISDGTLAGSPVEQMCNQVASEFLVDSAELDAVARQVDGQSVPDVLPLLVAFADARKVSPDLIAYRLLRAEAINEPRWTEIREALRERFDDLRQRSAEQGKSGGGDFYVVRRHRLGALVGFARRAMASGTLTPSKAGLVLGVKPRMVQQLVGYG
jgi:Zn-dependent peptidase ImmA (M78 family)/transcriptional regulator with XRE-family HTH domain